MSTKIKRNGKWKNAAYSRDNSLIGKEYKYTFAIDAYNVENRTRTFTKTVSGLPAGTYLVTISTPNCYTVQNETDYMTCTMLGASIKLDSGAWTGYPCENNEIVSLVKSTDADMDITITQYCNHSTSVSQWSAGSLSFNFIRII